MNNAIPTNMAEGNTLKSYLVSIGVNFDQEKLKDIQNKLKNFANMMKQAFLKPVEAIKNFASKFVENFKKPLETVKNFTGKMSKAFTDINKKIKAFMQTMQKAFSVVTGFASSVISASVAVGKFMNNLAKQDLALDNFSRRMGVSKKTAREFKSAVDSLGASVEEIQFNPELLKQYKDLVADGRKMAVAGDYDKAMANVRSLGFEFVRLKNEANYVFQWVGYYLTKYLAGPMKAAKKYFQGFNEWIIKNTPQISAKIAEVMARIADVFGSVFKFFGKVGTALSQWWSGQPTWVKNMMAGVGILGAIFLGAQNPLLAIGMAIAGIFLLIDDYVRWTQNRESALGKIWEAITKACQKVKPVIEDWKNKAIKWFGEVKDWFVENGPAIQTFWSNFKIWVGEACDWVIDKTGKLLQSLKEFTGKLGFLTHQIEEKGFWPAVKGLFNGDFEADWQKFKQGDQAIESEWRNNLIQKRIIEISQRDSDRKNKEREQYIAEGGDITHFNDFYYNKLWKEASHELTEEGKLKPWTAGSKTDQLSTPKPANYNEQTDKYDDIINDAGNKYGVSQQVIKAIIAQESNFDPNVVSPKGAQGLMQLTPIAQKQVGGIKNPFDPRENIFKGVQYYKWCLEQVGGDRDLALIAYNAGPTYAKLIKEEREKKKNWSYDDIGYDETRQYVKNITSYLKNGKYAFSVDNANYLKASTSLINMKGLYQHDNSSCGLTSVAMANNYLNGNQNLDDIELRRRYGDNFSLQGVANDTVNSNYRWVDKGNIGYKGWDNDIDNALAKGYPVIVAGNGKGVSESGNGHIFVIYGKKNDKYLVKDPNEGKITDITKERLLSDEKHPDGNFVFIPEYIGKEKESRLRPQNPTPQQATSKKPKSIVNANKTTPPRGGRVNPRIATTSNKATQLIQTTRNSVITEKNIEEYKKQQDSIENNRRLVNGYKEASFWQMLVDWGHDEWGRGIDRVDGTSSSTTSYNITVNVIAEDDPYKTGEKIAVSLNNKMQFLNNSRNFGYA